MKLEASRTIENFTTPLCNRKECSNTEDVEGTRHLYATIARGMKVFSFVKRFCTNYFDKGVCDYDNGYRMS